LYSGPLCTAREAEYKQAENIPKMKEIEDTIGVDTDRSSDRRRVCLVATSRVL